MVTLARTALSAVALAALFVSLPVQSAHAQAAVYLTQAEVPASLDERGLMNFMRRSSARQLREEDDHQTWKFKVGTFFRRPPGDLECHLLFYDVEHGSRLFVTEMTVFLSNREETAFLQNVTLSRPQFKPQNRYIVVLTVRRQEMASANLELIGRPIHRSGVVEFSDEEAHEEEPDRQRALDQAAAEAQRVAVAREQARQREYEEAMRDDGSSAGSAGGEEETADSSRDSSGAASSGGCASCAIGRSGSDAGAVVAALAMLVAAVLCRVRQA